MKEKLKEWLFLIAYFVGGVLIFGFIESNEFQESTIGNVIMILSAIAMICLFLYLGYISIVDFYIRFKERQNNKLRQEVYQVMKEQKELEKLLNKVENNEKNKR